MKSIYTLFIILFVNQSYSQTISGKVVNTKHQPLIGATVLELSTQNGTITDVKGSFELSLISKQSSIVISYSGYVTDTLEANQITGSHIQLKEDLSQLDEVVVKAKASFIDNLETKHFEVITEAELTKAACCNLSESFETNASVDVSFSDAVTGTKTIKMLGLDGKYVQINRENTPLIRGLLLQNGLGYVPGTWIQSIDVGKGAGSVVNGFESMTGQINLEFKKPESSESLYMNSYVNSLGRVELNVNHARNLSDKWSMAILTHADLFNNSIDRNDDGFMDLPKSRQINVINRYKYQGEKVVSQIGFNYLADQKAGGQVGFGFDDDHLSSSLYGFSNQTNRIEVFGKTGLLFPHKPYKGWGFIYSGSYVDIDAGYGKNSYEGQEKTLYANLIYQNIISNSFHEYKAGISYLRDDFNESYVDSTFSRAESIPGIYTEYTFKPSERFTSVIGLRYDFHNLYDNYFTPRLHLRYQLTDKTTVRTAIGKGYRTPNALIENSRFLVSSRNLRVLSEPLPEISWNIGGSIVSSIDVLGKEISVVADYFYTSFENQLIYDLDQNPNELNIYNLDGNSFAHSFQVELSTELNEYWNIKSAYKYYEVKSTINGSLVEVPFNAKHRFFLNTSYATKYDKWKGDLTIQWIGEKRLPNTASNAPEFQRPNRSEAYGLVNMQVSRGFRWGSIYLGSENLFNFQQPDPIIDAENPFGNDFDAGIVWAPIVGRLIYAGLRYKIDRLK